MCGPCLDLGLSKSTIKCHFWAKSGYFILEWVLDDINFISRANDIVVIYRNVFIFYRCIETMCEICLTILKYHCTNIKEKNAKKEWRKQVWQNGHTWIWGGVLCIILFGIFHNKQFKMIFRVLPVDSTANTTEKILLCLQ